MSALYGSLRGCRQTVTRTGSKSSGMKASLQSFAGSVICYMKYDNDNKLIVSIEMEDNASSSYGDTMFRGTYEELKEVFETAKLLKEKKASLTIHRKKSNKMKQLEKLFG